MHLHRLSTHLLCVLLMSHGTYTLGQVVSGEDSTCGPLRPPGQYGPYDFRKDRDKISVVVDNHFQPMVEHLISGQTSMYVGGDIDFTLRAIPNHPNALMSMMLLGEKEKTTAPRGSRYSVECWFERAIRFRPDDNVVRMIYTNFLTKKKRKPEAMQQLDIVLTTAKDNALTYNNVGLLYFDLGEYQKALVQAHKAIELGLNRPDLPRQLQSVGKWSDPVAETSEIPSNIPSPKLEAPAASETLKP